MTTNEFSFAAALPHFQRPWTLDGTQYLFTLQFNTRASLWFLSIASATGAPIVAGLALRVGRNLLEPYATLGVPRGLLFVYDQSGQNADPGRDSFATTHKLLYVS